MDNVMAMYFFNGPLYIDGYIMATIASFIVRLLDYSWRYNQKLGKKLLPSIAI